MSANTGRDDVGKTAGMVGVGLLSGGVAALLTDIPPAAVFAIAFGVFAVQKLLER